MIAGDHDFVAVWQLAKPAIEAHDLLRLVAEGHEISCVNQDVAVWQVQLEMTTVGITHAYDADTGHGSNLQWRVMVFYRWQLQKMGLYALSYPDRADLSGARVQCEFSENVTSSIVATVWRQLLHPGRLQRIASSCFAIDIIAIYGDDSPCAIQEERERAIHIYST